MKSPRIRILERSPNKRGDLFGRLMEDLFLALGYDQARFNIHKSRREIDVEATHRTEPRQIRAECKATKEKIGGADINKFVGALDAERRKSNKDLTGYFISLSGYRETAIEQEKDAGGERLILLDGEGVLNELIKGRIIITPEIAMEQAGRCAANQSKNLKAEDKLTLLAHKTGWIWLILFTHNKQKTHCSLIHADGESLANNLADEIIKSDKTVGGKLHKLTYLLPEDEGVVPKKQTQLAKEKYFEYLSAECGEIELEGMPADQEVGSQRLNLENLFVPMHLDELSLQKQGSAISQEEERVAKNPVKRQPVGKVLDKQPRLAILASPGGGKSTLIKRLVNAYTVKEKRELVKDDLPDRKWMPLFIRCRQLGENATSPIQDIIGTIPKRAEMDENLSTGFMQVVNESLRSGNILLLIDGLDEISNEGNRVAFVKQLRIFLAVYPKVSIVVTSREAGFRIIGGALSAICNHFTLAEFNDDDIRQLTLAWHKEVVGDRAKVREDAEKLCEKIINTDRVRQLAQNPLLLTTLLLVKRWVGRLPTKRSVLYGKAIEVLLMTWNVEGHEPIEEDEAIPQLAFVAYEMMKEGEQRISLKKLKELLKLARKQMPEILGFAKLGVSEFIERIELRSSLLIQSGHEEIDGKLHEMYEFRHLTFQEYLTAQAIVEGFFSKRRKNDTLLSMLSPHLKNDRWKEVVPLAAVLAGRNAGILVQHLIELGNNLPGYMPNTEFSINYPIILLSQCIIDEVQAPPDIIREALLCLVQHSSHIQSTSSIQDIYHNKYGSEFFEIAKSRFVEFEEQLTDSGNALAHMATEFVKWPRPTPINTRVIDQTIKLLNDNKIINKAMGALIVMEMAFTWCHGSNIRLKPKMAPRLNFEKQINKLINTMIPLLFSNTFALISSSLWAIAWIGQGKLWSPINKPEILPRIVSLWEEHETQEIAYFASWALNSLPIIDRAIYQRPIIKDDLSDFIEEQYSIDYEQNLEESSDVTIKLKNRKQASIVLGFYLRSPWNARKISTIIKKDYYEEEKLHRWPGISETNRAPNTFAMLEQLGKSGELQINSLLKKAGKE